MIKPFSGSTGEPGVENLLKARPATGRSSSVSHVTGRGRLRNEVVAALDIGLDGPREFLRVDLFEERLRKPSPVGVAIAHLVRDEGAAVACTSAARALSGAGIPRRVPHLESHTAAIGAPGGIRTPDPRIRSPMLTRCRDLRFSKKLPVHLVFSLMDLTCCSGLFMGISRAIAAQKRAEAWVQQLGEVA